MVIFFRTKEFDEEHRSDNQKVVSKLTAEFKTACDHWVVKRNAIPDEEHLPELLPDLERLAKIGSMIEKWNKQITTGKGLLHKASGSILWAGTLFSGGVAIFANEDPYFFQSGGVAIFLGLVGGAYAYKFMNDYLSLKRRIAEKSDKLRLGRPVVDEAEL